MTLRSRLGRLEHQLPSLAPEEFWTPTPMEAAQIMLAAYRRLGPDLFPDAVNELANAFAGDGTEVSAERFRQAIGDYFESQRSRQP